MKLRTLTIAFIVLWIASAIAVPYFAGSLDRAGNFGSSFGAVSALFSGFALALAISSMVLQQRQSAEFEKATLGALTQQAAAIKLIEQTLLAQANTAKVTALSALIDREQQWAETLRQWGEVAGDVNKYGNGIKAANARLEKYHVQLREYAGN